MIAVRWTAVLGAMVGGALVGGALVGGAVAEGAAGGAAARRPEAGRAVAAEAVAGGGVLRRIIASGRLSDLRWPDFSDYRRHLERFYGASDYAPAWIAAADGRATPQARALIEILGQADRKGLNAEDYDVSRWAARLDALGAPGTGASAGAPAAPGAGAAADAAARFDAALSVCAMRYISDLHIGKINPRHFEFGLSVENKKYDLAEFLRGRLVSGADLASALEEVEPPFAGYRRTRDALQQYLTLASEDDGEPLPVPAKAVEPGTDYAGTPRLTRLLRLLGDLPASETPARSRRRREGSHDLEPDGQLSGTLYQDPLVDGVKRFQDRHGLDADGRLGPQTLKCLNIPLTRRVEQLRLTLERWRWVPHDFPHPPVVVNIPAFRLVAFDGAGHPALSMKVIVGKAYRHQTPVFAENIRFVVFRPYWNVPPSIRRSEIAPAIARNRRYLIEKGYEVVDRGGRVVADGVVGDEVLGKLRAGTLDVRQKPGPSNALGLVKIMFPNRYNVYLHSTPQPELFERSRRDFSHGCIRVEKPAELAAWVLSEKPEWSLERVRAAMQGTKDDVQVNLAKPIPVLILYGTAIVDESGIVRFYDDIYGHDAALEKVLEKGYPYPG